MLETMRRWQTNKKNKQIFTNYIEKSINRKLLLEIKVEEVHR